MIDAPTDPNVHDWWADAYGTGSNNMWVNVDTFKSDIIDNYNNNKRGVQGHVGSLSVTCQGDYMYIPGHVFLVVGTNDSNGNNVTDYGEIYYSAHTNNRCNVRFADSYPTPPSGLQYVWIICYQT